MSTRESPAIRPSSPGPLFSGPRGFAQADNTLVPWQFVTLIVLLAGLTFCLVWSPWRTLLTLNALVTIVYLFSTFYRTLLIDVSLRRSREISIEPEELATVGSRVWPKYLVIVPIYKEAEILPELVAALARLDYPPERLEIRLLIEADDQETMRAAHNLHLAPPFVIFPIPVSYPRTKPKACNAAIESTDADFLVIFDAEDRPDADQLRKAVLAFDRVPGNVVCIQAKLNFYNADYNFLTRCFATEYATWYDLCLPGLDFLRAPIPLGGTSNHFRMGALRALKGWDEYNVTEDCDLGLRLFCAGWRTRIINSTTWEQACPSLPYWIKQRSRWVKGYIQTYLVHLRQPFRLLAGLGISNSLHFHLLIGGTAFCQLVNPIYWALTLVWIVSRSTRFSAFFPGPIFVMAALCLFVGNFLFAYTCSIACVRRNFGHLAKYGLLMPVYWVLMSIGAWKGFLQLITNPHYWEKTKHFGNPEPAAEATGNRS